jgi:hypothetical protein
MLVGDTLGIPIADALAARPHDTSSLRFLTAGSALLSVATKRRLLEEVPHLEIRDSLGASETGLQAIARATGGRIEESFTLLPGNDVLDDQGQPVPPGAQEPGSLARVEHVAVGYYRDEAATARGFRHGPHGRFAVTGDAVRKGADGTVTLLGREATCINTGGEKVFAWRWSGCCSRMTALPAAWSSACRHLAGVGRCGRSWWDAAAPSTTPRWTPMPAGRWPGTKCRSATSRLVASNVS